MPKIALPGELPKTPQKASVMGPSLGAQAAPWGAKKGPKKPPSTGGKFAKKSSQIGPQRVPQGPCLGRAGRARWAGVRGSLGWVLWPVGGMGFGVGLAEVVCRGGLDWWSVLGGFLVGFAREVTDFHRQTQKTREPVKGSWTGNVWLRARLITGGVCLRTASGYGRRLDTGGSWL